MATTPNPLPSILAPERRFADLSGAEIRAVDEDAESIGFRGHAAVFGKRAWIGPPKWGFFEEVRAGAFAKTIQESDVRMLQNHDPNLILARSKVASGPGTLRLSEDDVGLLSDAEMLPTTYARDLALAIDRQVVNQMSFAFTPVREEWSVDDDGNDVRTLIEVKLYDVSPVTFPAFEETDASLRAIAAELEAAGSVPVEERKHLLRAFFGRVPVSDLALALRAALNAPVGLEDNGRAPASATRAQDQDPSDFETERIRLAMRGLAVMASDFTTLTTKEDQAP